MIIPFDNVSVEIMENMLRKLLKHEQYYGMYESGGILLGKRTTDGKKYIITDITEQNQFDRSGPLFFVRDRIAAQKRINDLWIESKGLVNYIGEWHTHPCKNPRPSTIDRVLMQKIFEEKSNVWNEAIMIIVGQQRSLYVGVYSKSCGCNTTIETVVSLVGKNPDKYVNFKINFDGQQLTSSEAHLINE